LIPGSAWTANGAAARAGRLALPALLVATSLLAACAVTSAPPAGVAGPVQVRPQHDWSDAIIYFVLLDRFADGDRGNDTGVNLASPGAFHGGDLKGLAAELDEIASLGATAVWITPLVRQIAYCPWAQGNPESGFAGSFEHCAFHGYWADDYQLLDPHFGSEADLKALVDAAHARGLKVLLDVVYNHAGYESRYLTDPATRDWFRSKPVDCAIDPLTCQVGGLPDFRTELPEVREYLFAAHLGLARRTGLDGFRLDTVKHIDHDFWKLHRQATRERVATDFFLVGEVWGGSAEVLDPYFAGDEMDAGFDFTFKGSCESFVQGKGRTVAFSAYLERRHRVRAGYHLSHYLSSHDEPMALYDLRGDKEALRLCVALQMTSLGIPMIYYGEEVARPGSVWPMNRTDMPWGDRDVAPGRGGARDESLRDYYQRLIQVRRDHRSLSSGAYRALSTDGDLLVFERSDASSGDVTVVAVNRGRAAASVAVPAPPAWNGAPAVDAIDGAAAAVTSGMLAVEVPPRSARVYAGS
jgi:alpha-amylase